jgi:hypothetical protein
MEILYGWITKTSAILAKLDGFCLQKTLIFKHSRQLQRDWKKKKLEPARLRFRRPH